jgi:hypothetical protein
MPFAHRKFIRAAVLCTAFAALGSARDFSSYRGMQFGMTLTAAAEVAGTHPNEVRTLHLRPALIQEMDWQPIPSSKSEAIDADPVRDALLCFYNGELFRMVITYDRYKVEGMTADDMIEGISATYGKAARPTAEVAMHSNYGEVAPVIARWEDSQYAYNLVRTGDRSSYALVLTSKRLDTAALAATTEAIRLETQEAPQREMDKQKKRDRDEHLVLEKARLVNKPNFRP